MAHHAFALSGRWSVGYRLPRGLAGDSIWGRLLDCFHCLSLWVAAPIAFFIGDTFVETFLLWPALSAGAILAEGIANSRPEPQPTKFIEDEEDTNGMLRKAETTVLQYDPESTES